MIFKVEEIQNQEQRFRTNFINSLSGVKSLNLCGTQNKIGQSNLAIFNSVVHIGANPPLMGMVFRPDSVERHTLTNIKETGCFSLNAVSQSIYKSAHQTSARYPKEISEFEAVNLEFEVLNGFLAPFVKDSPLKMALKMREELKIQSNGTIFIIGAIEFVSIDERMIQEDGFFDLTLANIVGGISLDGYCETKLLERLPYAKP